MISRVELVLVWALIIATCVGAWVAFIEAAIAFIRWLS